MKLSEFAPSYLNITRKESSFIQAETGLGVIGDGTILYFGFLMNEQMEFCIFTNKQRNSIRILSFNEQSMIWTETFGPFTWEDGLTIWHIRLVNSTTDKSDPILTFVFKGGPGVVKIRNYSIKLD